MKHYICIRLSNMYLCGITQWFWF